MDALGELERVQEFADFFKERADHDHWQERAKALEQELAQEKLKVEKATPPSGMMTRKRSREADAKEVDKQQKKD